MFMVDVKRYRYILRWDDIAFLLHGIYKTSWQPKENMTIKRLYIKIKSTQLKPTENSQDLMTRKLMYKTEYLDWNE